MTSATKVTNVQHVRKASEDQRSIPIKPKHTSVLSNEAMQRVFDTDITVEKRDEAQIDERIR